MSKYIDANAFAYIVASNGDVDFINKVTRLMLDAPSIDIEPKHGEWINKNGHTHYCSVCGFEETEWYTKDYNFCPHCGADMRGKNDD